MRTSATRCWRSCSSARSGSPRRTSSGPTGRSPSMAWSVRHRCGTTSSNTSPTPRSAPVSGSRSPGVSPATDPAGSERLFVSRRRHGDLNRLCRDADQVESVFADHGFDIVYPEDYSLPDQAALFRTARVVAGFGGSGMFNLMHCQQLRQRHRAQLGGLHRAQRAPVRRRARCAGGLLLGRARRPCSPEGAGPRRRTPRPGVSTSTAMERRSTRSSAASVSLQAPSDLPPDVAPAKEPTHEGPRTRPDRAARWSGAHDARSRRAGVPVRRLRCHLRGPRPRAQ